MAKQRTTGDPEFDEFWRAYPLKVAKKHALRMWLKAIADADPLEIIEAAREFGMSEVGRGEFCPHPGTWLNDGRWEDDRSAWNQSRRPTTGRKDYGIDPNLFRNIG